MTNNGRKPVNQIKGELARRGILRKELARHPLVDLSDGHLSDILRGRKPLTPRMAEAIKRAIDELAPVSDGGD